MTRYKIVIEYDGSDFCGWQRQQDALSVQEVLEDALFKFSQEKTEVQGSGRTDAGVHAYGQVAHFDIRKETTAFRVKEALNALVRPYPIGILDCEEVPEDFNARFSAKKRSYVYKILNRRTPAILDRKRAWHVLQPLDVEKMKEAASLMLGKHDFSTFRASECQAKSPVKTLDSFDIIRENEIIYCYVTARSFLHHQVRNMVGTLVLVGQGVWTVADFKRAFETCNRTKGGPTAPADGLYLKEILY